MTALELAVRFGKTLIIQEMDGVEPVLYPLLRRDLIAQGTVVKCTKPYLIRILGLLCNIILLYDVSDASELPRE